MPWMMRLRSRMMKSARQWSPRRKKNPKSSVISFTWSRSSQRTSSSAKASAAAKNILSLCRIKRKRRNTTLPISTTILICSSRHRLRVFRNSLCHLLARLHSKIQACRISCCPSLVGVPIHLLWVIMPGAKTPKVALVTTAIAILALDYQVVAIK